VGGVRIMAFEDFVDLNQMENEESEFKRLINEFFNRKNIDLKTELSDNEIKEITRLILLSKILKIGDLKDFVEIFMNLRVSLSRQGRKEFISAILPPENSNMSLNPNPSLIINPYANVNEGESQSRSIKKRLFGRRK